MKFLFIFFSIFPFVFSQTQKTGVQFLQLGLNARSSAMGDAFTAVTNDHSAFNLNPATIHQTKGRQLILSHWNGFADVTSDYLGATIPSENFTFAISAFTSAVSEIEVRLRPGDAEGLFDARNASLGAGLSTKATDELYIGVSGKLLYEKIYIDEASGYAFDAGMLYSISNDINVGASILNIGKMSVLRSQSSVLPTSLRIGGSYVNSLSSEIALLATSDIVKVLDNDGMHLHIGIEADYQSQIMLRAGYQTGYETKSFSGGIGVQYSIIRIDYAFIPMSGAFSSTHLFSLMFNL